jgi:hypothetical protein
MATISLYTNCPYGLYDIQPYRMERTDTITILGMAGNLRTELL